MKRTLLNVAVIVILLALPAFSMAQARGTGTPPPPCHSSSHNPFSYMSSDWYDHWCANEYCFCSQQITPDSWLLTIDQVGNEPAHLSVEYSYDHTVSGVKTPSGWLPVTSWPLQFTSGIGDGYSNFHIRILNKSIFGGGPLRVPGDCQPQEVFSEGYGYEFLVGSCN